jgi:hypothetical protein
MPDYNPQRKNYSGSDTQAQNTPDAPGFDKSADKSSSIVAKFPEEPHINDR